MEDVPDASTLNVLGKRGGVDVWKRFWHHVHCLLKLGDCTPRASLAHHTVANSGILNSLFDLYSQEWEVNIPLSSI